MVDLRATIRQPWFIPAAVVIAAILIGFWPIIYVLPQVWTRAEGYYSHGMIVPIISGYIIFKNWDKLKVMPVRPFLPAIVPLVILLLMGLAASETEFREAMSLCFIASMILGTWVVAGGKWMLAVTPPLLYTAFMFPLWDQAIDKYTNPLQVISTDVSYALLQVIGFNPLRDGSTFIYLNNFVLNVGAPCSGMKLLLSVTAFTVFFLFIARLGLWGNIIMVALIIPFCLLMNGFRIALIGIVGNIWGKAAGTAFHDYSGYIMLVVCFMILFKIARWLGWKD